MFSTFCEHIHNGLPRNTRINDTTMVTIGGSPSFGRTQCLMLSTRRFPKLIKWKNGILSWLKPFCCGDALLRLFHRLCCHHMENIWNSLFWASHCIHLAYGSFGMLPSAFYSAHSRRLRHISYSNVPRSLLLIDKLDKSNIYIQKTPAKKPVAMIKTIAKYIAHTFYANRMSRKIQLILPQPNNRTKHNLIAWLFIHPAIHTDLTLACCFAWDQYNHTGIGMACV